jgi:eukaryotic-like serine/threonine-protein kinase
VCEQVDEGWAVFPMIAKRLGHYSIGEQLGRGGMGEVYLADDLNLNRKVALKFLPDAFAKDPERMARFEREAKLLASLNHPNIAAIYGLEQAEGKRFLVLELVEGETLAQRISKGPLPVEEALGICRQIAEGLEAAHEKGVIHRDLKPANVMITEGDKVKILDFGLAKALSDEAQSVDSSQSPTLTEAMTRPGVILGTAAHMSPEQAKGKAADKRADIWAWGCILYECLTGGRPFEGETVTETLAAILTREPEWEKVPAKVHPLLRWCLERDPKKRLRDIGDAYAFLESVQGSVPEKRSRPWLAWALAIVAVAVALAAILVPRMVPKTPAPALARFAVTAPPGTTAVTDGSSAAVSPDGRRLAFTVVDTLGVTRLCIRALDSFSSQLLAGTENAILPFWSPDSRSLAFFAGGKLRKVPAEGGTPEVICDAPNGRGGSWNRNGMIIFAPMVMGPLLMVPADGGEPVEVAKPDAVRHEIGLRFPFFLSDGRHYLYVSLPRKKEGFDVYLGELDSRQHKRIMVAGGAPVCAGSSHLLFVQGNRLAAQEFDRLRLRPAGRIVFLDDAPPTSYFEGSHLLSASENGVLIHAGTHPPDTQLVWLDRAGRSIGSVPLQPAKYVGPSLSADGRWATVAIANSPTSADLWLVDLERAVTTRLTFDGLVESGVGTVPTAVWSPDGSSVAYAYKQSGIQDVYHVLTNGMGKPEPLVQSNAIFKTPATWSPDGKYFVWSQNVESIQWDLWLLPMQEDRKPVPYLRTPFDENTATISPDGRWLAYDSNETGRSEIYVRSFPEPREKHRITSSGGSAVQWSRDGRELLIWSSDQWAYTVGSIFSVDVQTSLSFKAGTPRLLFTPRQDLMGIAATADLNRFLAAIPAEGSDPPGITVILYWQAGLKK